VLVLCWRMHWKGFPGWLSSLKRGQSLQSCSSETDSFSSRVARAVDIIDQLSTTFIICLCTMYKENFLDYPSQLY